MTISRGVRSHVWNMGHEWRIGDQWWEHRRDNLVNRRGHIVGLQTWVLYQRLPEGDKVQAVQHKYGLYPFSWDRTRHIPRRRTLDEQVWDEFCRMIEPGARDAFGLPCPPASAVTHTAQREITPAERGYIMDDHGVAQPR